MSALTHVGDYMAHSCAGVNICPMIRHLAFVRGEAIDLRLLI